MEFDSVFVGLLLNLITHQHGLKQPRRREHRRHLRGEVRGAEYIRVVPVGDDCIELIRCRQSGVVHSPRFVIPTHGGGVSHIWQGGGCLWVQ